MTTLSWMSRGACRDADPELFFPLSDTGPALRQIERARAICRQCPVLTTCLRYAMDTHQHGIWAATTHEERRAMQRPARRAAHRVMPPARHEPAAGRAPRIRSA
jgi:WhiB family transcriptional regulator, redox-sensing transcriptional regulator